MDVRRLRIDTSIGSNLDVVCYVAALVRSDVGSSSVCVHGLARVRPWEVGWVFVFVGWFPGVDYWLQRPRVYKGRNVRGAVTGGRILLSSVRLSWFPPWSDVAYYIDGPIGTARICDKICYSLGACGSRFCDWYAVSSSVMLSSRSGRGFYCLFAVGASRHLGV